MAQSIIGLKFQLEHSFKLISMMKHQMEPDPIAVYDVEHKKLVIVAKSPIVLGRYVSDTPQFERHFNKYISDKLKHSSNRFNRVVAYRKANTEQRNLLGGNDIIIFSKEYDINTKTRIVKKLSY